MPVARGAAAATPAARAVARHAGASLASLSEPRSVALRRGDDTNTRTWANGLGWFSIALGLTEIVAAKPLAKALGVRSPNLLRAFGLREIVAGLGVLTQERKGPWIWARIGGDILDVAVLGSALSSKNPQRGNAALAMAIVSPVVALDLVCGERLRLSA